MGTNYVDFLLEARRVLKVGGTLFISEVNSRIPNMDLFIELLNTLGFNLAKKVILVATSQPVVLFICFNTASCSNQQILPNNYFCLLLFKKQSEPRIDGNSPVSKFSESFAG